jgi:hypothetical protein
MTMLRNTRATILQLHVGKQKLRTAVPHFNTVFMLDVAAHLAGPTRTETTYVLEMTYTPQLQYCFTLIPWLSRVRNRIE